MTDHDFPDTIIAARCRETMDFRPASYEAAHAASEIDDDEDSEFGALQGLVQGRRFIVGAWVVIFAAVAVVWWLV